MPFVNSLSQLAQTQNSSEISHNNWGREAVVLREKPITWSPHYKPPGWIRPKLGEKRYKSNEVWSFDYYTQLDIFITKIRQFVSVSKTLGLALGFFFFSSRSVEKQNQRLSLNGVIRKKIALASEFPAPTHSVYQLHSQCSKRSWRGRRREVSKRR